MPDIETLDIFTINFNTIESKEADGLEKYKTNTRQEINAPEKHYKNTNGSIFHIEAKPMFNDNNNDSISFQAQTVMLKRVKWWNHTMATERIQRCI